MVFLEELEKISKLRPFLLLAAVAPYTPIGPVETLPRTHRDSGHPQSPPGLRHLLPPESIVNHVRVIPVFRPEPCTIAAQGASPRLHGLFARRARVSRWRYG